MVSGSRVSKFSLAGVALICVTAVYCALAPSAMAELPAQLSNETTFTRWANPATTGPIRSEPKKGARTIARLHFQTENRQAEVYIALRSEVDEEGRAWILIRIPGKPNGRKGWVEQEDLNPLQLIHTQIVINRGSLKLTLFKRGKKVMSAPVGVGKSSTPTPAGNFWIREKLRSLSSAYGPWAMGTSAYSSIRDWSGLPVVAIHGTNQPYLVPGRPSHGCVRMKNKSISKLVRKAPLGTPVRIN